MGFKINSASAVSTGTLHLKDASDNLLYAEGPAGQDGKPSKLPVTVTVHGPGSDEYARAETARTNRSLDRMRKKGKVKLAADETKQESADFLTAITVRFDNLDYDDQPVDANGDLIHRVYSDRSIGFIAEQVQEYARDWENFSSSSATS